MAQNLQGTLIKSTIGVDKIKKSVMTFNKSINTTQKTAIKINTSLSNSNRQKQQSIRLSVSNFQKRREAVRRREREDIIEASGISGAIRRQGKVISSSTKGFLGRILDFIGTLMVGWLLNNLPTIIRLGEQLITRMGKLYVILRSFVGNVTSILSGFGSLLMGTSRNLIAFDFSTQKQLIDNSLSNIQNGMFGIEMDFNRAIDLLSQPLDLGFNELDIPEEKGEAPPAAPEGVPTSPSGGTKYPQLAEAISAGEGGLNSVNRRTAGDTPGGAKSVFGKNLTEMTVGEIMEAQRRGQVFAVGKYQFIPGTLASAVAYTKTPLNAKFDSNTQNRLFDYLVEVKRPIVGQYMRGESNNKREAIQELAREFAAVGLEYPEAGRGRGESRYSGLAGNRASISPEKIGKVLEQQRTAGPQNITPTPTPVRPVTGSRVVDTAKISQGGNRTVALTPGQGFGAYRSPTRSHAGIDIHTSGQTGWLVGFKGSGTVTYAGVGGGYGNLVIIKSGNTEYYFAHLARIMVKLGTYNGQVIGEIGNTGGSRGIHLHYEVRPNGNPIDPKPYLNLLDIGRTTVADQTAAKPATSTGIQIASAKPSTTQVAAKITPERTGKTVVVPIPEMQVAQAPQQVQSSSGGGLNVSVDKSGLNRYIEQSQYLSLA
jgi:murein DD-endopeptidase MepM/ murein hydrolase activator NlpD